jgi:hypothetical protein
MKQRLYKKKLKLLKVRLRSLKEELDLTKDIFNNACEECTRLYQESSETDEPAESIEPTPQLLSSQESNFEYDLSPKQEEATPEAKKIFKRIASKIHPDKLASLEDTPEKFKNLELFEKAREAMSCNDLLELSLIAEGLDIEEDLSLEEKIKNTEVHIISIKEEVNKLQSTLMWQWFFCEEEQLKETLQQKLFKHLYE